VLLEKSKSRAAFCSTFSSLNLIKAPVQSSPNLGILNMMQYARGLLIIVFLMISNAFAHSSIVNIDAMVRGNKFVVLLLDPSGFPVKSAKLNYLVYNEAGISYRDTLLETGNGEYSARLQKIVPGKYKLVIQDTTFPRESLEAKADVEFPIQKTVTLVLPASTAGGPGTSLLILVAVTPVALSVLVLVFVLFRRPKIQTLEPPTQP
jgi:hypothetical protein